MIHDSLKTTNGFSQGQLSFAVLNIFSSTKINKQKEIHQKDIHIKNSVLNVFFNVQSDLIVKCYFDFTLFNNLFLRGY